VAPEAPLDQIGSGLKPQGEGWFVLNAREASWVRRPGRGHSLPLTGWTDEECETLFPQLGVNLVVLEPGEPIGMYHLETDYEEFLVLSGEPLLIVEGEERRLRPWDFVHTPPGVEHMIVGAGVGPSVVVAIGGRLHMGGSDWGRYTVNETALRHGIGVETETNDPDVAYSRFAAPERTRYQEGWLDIH
jgi:uncharacterized cupin superfamily protein